MFLHFFHDLPHVISLASYCSWLVFNCSHDSWKYSRYGTGMASQATSLLFSSQNAQTSRSVERNANFSTHSFSIIYTRSEEVNPYMQCRSKDFPSGSAVKNPSSMQEPQETKFKPWVGKIPWRRAQDSYLRGTWNKRLVLNQDRSISRLLYIVTMLI